MPRRSYAHYVADWERLLVAVDANKEELAALGEMPAQLTAALESLKAAFSQQDDAVAQYRGTTRNVQGVIKQGADLANRLRNGLRMQYGVRNDKLLQFGLQPLRPQVRARKAKATKEKPDSVGQTESGS